MYQFMCRILSLRPYHGLGKRIWARRSSTKGSRDLLQYCSRSDTPPQSHGAINAGQSSSAAIRGKHPRALLDLTLTTHQAVNAQEVGDIDSAWRFTSAACTIVYALDLHKMANSFTEDRTDEAFEAFACFGFTYMQDKGLAMNLGRPACLQDLYIEEGVFERPIQEEPRPTLFYEYLNLARVQSRIITDLHSAARSSMLNVNGVVTDILGRMEELWQSSQEVGFPNLLNQHLSC
jgi:hypothetical protein